jgi:hypothetical protein
LTIKFKMYAEYLLILGMIHDCKWSSYLLFAEKQKSLSTWRGLTNIKVITYWGGIIRINYKPNSLNAEIICFRVDVIYVRFIFSPQASIFQLSDITYECFITSHCPINFRTGKKFLQSCLKSWRIYGASPPNKGYIFLKRNF